MNDVMRQGDQLAVSLDCGHPYKNAGELCELCGKTVPGIAEVTQSPADEAGSAKSISDQQLNSE